MKKTLTLAISLIMSVSLFAIGCSQKQAEKIPEQPKQGEKNSSTTYTHPDLLVDVNWLKDNLNNVVLLDARNEKSYNAKHITNAIHVAWQPFTDMEAKKPGDKGWGTLLESNKLAGAIGKLGIDGSKPVVIYNGAPEKTWGEDGRVAWTLKMAGVKNVKILNGGWDAWESKKYPTDNNVPTPESKNFTIASMDTSLNTTTDYVNSNLGKIKIIDTRDPSEYNGAIKYGEKRGGHLPGAINIPWTQVFNSDGTLKSQKDLDGLFSSKGITKNDEIVTYCTKGIRSGHMALVLRMAGYDKAKNYDASFYEWAGNESLKIEK